MYVSSLKPFGFRGYFIKDKRFHLDKNNLDNPIICYGKGKLLGYVERAEVKNHIEWIDVWKIFTPRANNIGTELSDDNLNSFIGEPGSICTESYIAMGMELNLTKIMAINLTKDFYMELQNLVKMLQRKRINLFHYKILVMNQILIGQNL